MISLPIEVTWDDTCESCIRIEFGSGWVWNDFHRALSFAHEMCESSNLTSLNYIFDVRDGHVFPRDVLIKLRRLNIDLHKKAETMVIVGQGTFIQALKQVLDAVSQAQTHIVHVASIEEAYQILGVTG